MTASRLQVNLRAKVIHELGDFLYVSNLSKFACRTDLEPTAKEKEKIRIVLNILYCVLYNIDASNRGNKKVILGYIDNFSGEKRWTQLQISLDKIIGLIERNMLDKPNWDVRISQRVDAISAHITTAMPFLTLLDYIAQRPMSKAVYIQKAALVRDAFRGLFANDGAFRKGLFLRQVNKTDRDQAQLRHPHAKWEHMSNGLHDILMKIIDVVEAKNLPPVPRELDLDWFYHGDSVVKAGKDKKHEEKSEQKSVEKHEEQLQVRDGFVYDDEDEETAPAVVAPSNVSSSGLSFLGSFGKKSEVKVDTTPLLGGPRR